jgi:hypothetical protein
MPGARCTRGLVCQELRIWRTRAYRFSGNTPTSPAQRLYGLLRALPGGAGLLSPSPVETSHRLSASIAAPGPHDFAVRSRPGFAKRLRRATAIRLWRAASIASRAQRVVTMAIRPSDGRETAWVIILIFRNCKRIFLLAGLTAQISLRSLANLDFSRNAHPAAPAAQATRANSGRSPKASTGHIMSSIEGAIDGARIMSSCSARRSMSTRN